MGALDGVLLFIFCRPTSKTILLDRSTVSGGRVLPSCSRRLLLLLAWLSLLCCVVSLVLCCSSWAYRARRVSHGVLSVAVDGDP